MTGLSVKRWLSITLAAASLATLVAAEPAAASTLRVSTGSAQRAANEVEADYTTSHVLISETAHESVPITVFFDPQVTGVDTAEVFTNLNRRDWATADPNGNGVEEGISPPSGNSIAAGDDRHYYKAYPMSPVRRRISADFAGIENRRVSSDCALPTHLGSSGHISLVWQRAERARDPQAGSRDRRLAGESQRPPAL